MKSQNSKFRTSEIHRLGKYFTLIELLVVIAIIAILASMLLPALKNARATAVKSLCLNQEKTMGLSISMYCNDYNGWVVPSSGDKPAVLGGNRANWAYYIAPYIYPDKDYWNMRKGTIFTCPADNTSRSTSGDPTNDVRSYVGNANIMGVNTTTYSPTVRESMVKNPSGTLVVGEFHGAKTTVATTAVLWTSTAAAIGAPFATYDCNGKWLRRTHGVMQNFLFFDAHVESLNLTEASGKNLLP